MNTTLNGHARRRAAKRALILTAATEVFFEDGYGRASMDKVLAKIGGSKRTLYNHFRSKEELFAAIVTNVSDRVLAALRPPLDAGDLRETLVTIGVGYLSVLLSPDGLALYRAMISEAPHFPELARIFFAKGPGRASDQLSDFFREHKRRGLLKVDDPQLAAGHVCRSSIATASQALARAMIVLDAAASMASLSFQSGREEALGSAVYSSRRMPDVT